MRFEQVKRLRDSPKRVVQRGGRQEGRRAMFLFATDCIVCVILRLTASRFFQHEWN